MALFNRTTNADQKVSTANNNNYHLPNISAKKLNKQDFNLGTNTFPKDFKGVNLNEIIANLSAKKVAGRAVNAQSENRYIQKLLDQILETNDLYDFVFSSCKYVSEYGAKITAIIKSKDNKIYFADGFPFNTNYTNFFSNLTSFYGYVPIGRLAQAYIKYGINSTSIEVLGLDNDPITDEKLLKTINNKYKIENKIEQHNLGFVPAVLFQNYPVPKLWNLAFADFYPDWNPVNCFQPILNELTELIYYELQANKTRVFTKLNPKEWEQIKNSNLFFDAGVNILPNYAESINTGQLTNWLEIQQGNPIISTYIEAINDIVNTALTMVGLSNNQDNDATMRTATEVMYNNSSDYETIMVKRQTMEKSLKELLIKSILILDNNKKLNYEQVKQLLQVEIKDNIGIDKQERLSEYSQLLSLGLKTPFDYYIEVEGMTEKEAFAKYENVKNFYKKEEQVITENNQEKEVQDNANDEKETQATQGERVNTNQTNPRDNSKINNKEVKDNG